MVLEEQISERRKRARTAIAEIVAKLRRSPYGNVRYSSWRTDLRERGGNQQWAKAYRDGYSSAAPSEA